MAKKRERIFNYVLILCTVAYIFFVIFYDHYRIDMHDKVLKDAGKEKAYAATMLLVFIILNILILGVGSAILSILLFVFTNLLFAKGKKRTIVFLVVLCICKILACALTVLGAVLAYSYAHTDWVMKLVYTLMPTLYLASIVHGLVFWKKIISDQ